MERRMQRKKKEKERKRKVRGALVKGERQIPSSPQRKEKGHRKQEPFVRNTCLSDTQKEKEIGVREAQEKNKSKRSPE
jgi:hypothetical protein